MKYWYAVPKNSARPPTARGWTMFSQLPDLNAARQNHVHPPRIASDASAAVVNGRNAASIPIDNAAIRMVPMRERVVAGRMNRFARMPAAMLAWSWMPGIDPDSLVDR